MKKQRKCISCGLYKNRDEMIKITKDYKSENVVINPNSLTFGRSAYLCYNQICIDTAFKKNKINKVLKISKIIDKSALIGLINSDKKN